jgi:Mannosyltransferase (PIG-V)
MATIASSAKGRATAATRVGIRIPVWIPVVCSRLIILASGTAGALFAGRAFGWREFDPHGVTLSLGRVGNVLAASTDRWDSVHYLNIAQHGYTNPPDTAFFPLYPWLMRAVAMIVQSYVLAGVLISVASFAVALVLLHRLTKEELGSKVADSTLLLLAFAPLSFFFTAVYSESLFLALCVGTFYLAKRQRFGLASLAACGATLTRVPGLVLVVPLAMMYLQSRGPLLRPSLGTLIRAVPLVIAPALTFGGFCVYLRTQGFTWLAAITNNNVTYYGRAMMTTPVLLWRSFYTALAGLYETLHGVRPIAPSLLEPFNLGFQDLVYFVVLVISIAALVATWKRLPKEYAVFSTLALLVCTWSGVVAKPLEGYDRYMLVVFPLWMATAAWLEEHRLTRPVVQVSSVMLVFYVVMFARWVFIA